MATNPWALGASYISVGNMRKILKVADKNRIYEAMLSADDDHDATVMASGGLDSRIASNSCYTSLNQINLLKEITRLDEQLTKYQEEKEKNATLMSTADLTDTKSLDSILSMIEDLCTHLQNLIDSKGILIERLREAHSDHMTIDAEFHRDLIEGFPLVAKQLGQLNSSIESIIWTNQFSLQKSSNLSSSCKDTASRLADIQCYYQALDESRALMRTRIRRHKNEHH